MTNAIAALGVVLTRDGNAIAEITKIGEPGKIRELIDASTITQTGGYREWIGGMRDGTELPLEGNFIAGDTNGQMGLQDDFDGETAQAFVLTFPTAITATWTFNAVVKEFKTGGFEVGGKVTFMATLKITGEPTLAVTASDGLTTPFFVISESAVVVPTAAQATYTYVATVLTGITSVTVTPTAAAGVIKVNGSTVATGVASSAITLGAAGSVTEVTITVTETAKTTKTYTIYITRAAS